jgi:predicted phage terminase large subunit-like protein
MTSKKATAKPEHYAATAQGLRDADTILNKKKALKSFAFFRKYYRDRDTPWHQQEMVDFAEANRWALILEPRTHGKTETMVVDYGLWRICKNPNIRILVVTQSDSLAAEFISPIKQEIMLNEGLQRDFNLAPLMKEAGHSIIVKRSKNLKDPTVAAEGWGGSVTGRKNDLILADDLFDTDDAMSKTTRETIERWFFKELINCLDMDGQILVQGTTKHYADLYADLQKGGDFKVLKRQAILNEAEHKVLWPERYPWDALQRIRMALGPIYWSAEYMNDPTPLTGELLKEEWLHFYEDHPEPLEIRFGVDPAISKSNTADFSAIVVSGRDKPTGNIYVLQAWKGHVDFPELLQEIAKWQRVWGAQKIFVEENAYQASIVQAAKAVSNMPIVGVKTVKDKVTRMLALSPHFQNGKIMVSRGQHDFLEEYLQFPRGAHDDILDALELSVHEWIATGGQKFGGVWVDFGALMRGEGV